MSADERTPDEDLDPGAYVGRLPEREAESIPGGVGPEDERVAAYDSRPGLAGEPDDAPDSPPAAEELESRD